MRLITVLLGSVGDLDFRAKGFSEGKRGGRERGNGREGYDVAHFPGRGSRGGFNGWPPVEEDNISFEPLPVGGVWVERRLVVGAGASAVCDGRPGDRCHIPA